MGQGGICLRRRNILYSALMLTGVNLLLRLVGTSFQVYLSRRVGAAGVGLLQLTMSVGTLAMVAGIAGIRTTSMYLTAEQLGQGQPGTVTWVMSGCIRYSLIAGGAVAGLLFFFAPDIARGWIGEAQVTASLRLFSAFLPVTCLCGVMTGYFTAANRIGTLAAIEVAEQLFSMAVTVFFLTFWAGSDPSRACQSVILGSSMGSLLTLTGLLLLRLREREKRASPIPVARRLLRCALPLAAADDLRTGISTLENLMVPKRLALNPGVDSALASFGILSGMVFPVLMFPACILYGLADLLIPELARCAAADSRERILYLVKRSLRITFVYALLLGGGMFLSAQSLAMGLYQEPQAAYWLRRFSLLIPMLYCDALVDAMTKGLGQQRACVRYNIITSAMDVAGLYFLLPLWGMEGYFLSFLLTHMLNFLLSLGRLLKICGLSIPIFRPALALAFSLAWALLCRSLPLTSIQLVTYFTLLMCTLFLLGILRREDLHWLKNLIRPSPSKKPPLFRQPRGTAR